MNWEREGNCSAAREWDLLLTMVSCSTYQTAPVQIECMLASVTWHYRPLITQTWEKRFPHRCPLRKKNNKWSETKINNQAED